MSHKQDAGLGKGRIETLIDGIFAIAMTLLVLAIHLPELPPDKLALLWPSLLAMWPKFGAWCVSFVVLGVFWVGHHNQFHYIRRSDRTLLWINIAFALVITFLPFSTALLGEYSVSPVAVWIYCANLIAAGLLLYGQWRHATDRFRLVDPHLKPELVATAGRRVLMGPLAYAIACGLAAWDTRPALAILALMPLYYVLPGRVDWHWHPLRPKLPETPAPD